MIWVQRVYVHKLSNPKLVHVLVHHLRHPRFHKLIMNVRLVQAHIRHLLIHMVRFDHLRQLLLISWWMINPKELLQHVSFFLQILIFSCSNILLHGYVICTHLSFVSVCVRLREREGERECVCTFFEHKFTSKARKFLIH
jgi:hypothetical protein